MTESVFCTIVDILTCLPGYMPKETLDQIAERMGVNVRTIGRWKKSGCNVYDPASLAEFREVAEARSKGWIKKRALDRQSSDDASGRETTEPTDLDADMSELPPCGDEGAAAALKRLEWFEMQAARRLQRAFQLGKENLIQSARDNYLKTAEALRRYEREVEEGKRDLGHLIPKSEAIEGARASALWFRLAWRSWLSSCLPDILSMSDTPRDAKLKCELSFSEILNVTLRNAQEATITLPEWASASIKEEFHIRS